jgi:uncharacterized protein YprB with RNaseH-like and TPR domain
MSSRIVLFDIESTNLRANFGYCLCFGWKMLGEKTTHVLSIADYKQHKSDPTNDAPLMRDVHKVLTEDADIIVTFYGKEFDRKFLNTRMLLAGLPPLPPLNSEHIDIYFTVRGNLLLHSNRLASVAETLGCPMQKTPLTGPIWVRAMAGDRKAIKYIEEHCIRDVDVLEWVYNKMRPFVRQHPRVSENREACRVCGCDRFESKGIRFTAGYPAQRLRCKQCGAWSFVKVKR